jgi:cellulose synthase/poly-beta-1,6-N-acetylglucosamine synthase-like glycosyltransferase
MSDERINAAAQSQPMQPLLSVVVIGRNEGERLRRCLESVRAMNGLSGGELEIIYVDSASTDGSAELAAGMGARVLTVKPQRPTAALGRNAGWRASRGEYVLFLDGDTILDPDFVKDSLPEFDHAKTAVVWGHRREIHPERSVYNRVLDLDWIAPAGLSDYCGGDALMRRSVLAEVDGYDEKLIAGEEPEMCRRMRGRGWEILHVDRMMTGHDLAMTRWSQYWRRATRTGYAYAEVSRRFRDTDSPLWLGESKRNFLRGGFWIAAAVGSVVAGALLFLVWPPLAALPPAGAIGLFALASMRTARRFAWKSPDRVTRFLYGMHSHFQQIPILIGQLQYRRDLKAGRARGLIEYKESAAGGGS